MQILELKFELLNVLGITYLQQLTKIQIGTWGFFIYVLL